MIFAAIFWILFLAKARCQFVREISMISCDFDASDCGWRPFRESSLWKMSNSTQDSDIPDNGQNFFLLRGTSVTAKVSMLISPDFQILPRKISFKQRIFCSGDPSLYLHFFEITGSPMAGSSMEFLTEMKCSQSETWEETHEQSEAESEDPEDEESVIGFQIVLTGTVKQGDVIAIQDLRLTDDTIVVIESTTTSTEDDMKNETTVSSLSTMSNTILTSEQDLQSITEMSFPYTEVNSTANSNFSSTNSLSITEDYQNDTTITSAISEYKSTEESTGTPLSTKTTSSIISTLTDTQDYSYSLCNATEEISTENITFTTSQDVGNQTNNSSVSPNTSSSKSENKDQKTTTSASTEDSTSSGSTDSAKQSLIIQNDQFLWRTVFISTLTAFFVYSLLSLLVNVIRKLMRRRKQWMLGRRSKNTTVRVEDREVIPLSVITKI